MAFEVACSQCEGRLMVEEAGVVVACPHCGAHLNIEAPPEPQAVSTDEPTDSPDYQPADDPPEQPDTIAEQPAEAAAEPEPSTDALPEALEQEVPTAATQSSDEAASVGEGLPAIEVSSTVPADETTPATLDSMPQFDAESEPVQQAAPESVAPATHPEPQPAAQPQQPAGGSIEAPSITSISAGRGVSRHTFTLIRNYAIAMTLAVIFLVYKLLNPNMSALESLPDVKPQKKDDKIVYMLVPEATDMPPGHLLSLGQSQRFGNLRVTPVRVTKEPVEFVHHLGDTGVAREPGPEVVKLWFEFENLSTDQHIAPLDGLVFKRDDNDFENVRSNNFACRLSQKKKGGELAFVYDLNEFHIWNLRNQHVDQEIAPGEKLTTFIPTSEDGVAQLMNSDEPLIWRVHFRKGYSPKNYGVTTVIEVAFKSSDIGAAATDSKVEEPDTEEAA
jgi:hypothetical protein